MHLNDPFPVNQLSPRVRNAILGEFERRHPTVLEVVLVPDTHWLKVPAIGPTTLAKLRSFTQTVRQSSKVASLSEQEDDELLAQREILRNKLNAVGENLRGIKAELRLRGLLT